MKKDNKLLMVGSEIVGATVFGLFLGLKCDEYFNTSPIFLIIFLILGTVSGMFNIIRKVKKFEE